MASSFSSGVGYLFEGFWSIGVKIAQPLVVNFVVFRREVELQSFYSAILIPSMYPLFFIKVYLTSSVVPISAVQQSDTYIIHICTFF